MAQLGRTFDATAHDTTQSDFELLPTGIYQLEVTASDVRKDDDDNKTLALTYDVVQPEEFKSRKIFAYIDLEHRETKKQEDGQRDFARLCRAIGLSAVEDSEELHFITFTAKVQNSPAGVSRSTGRPYKAKNRIQRFYFPDEGNVPEPAIDAAQPAKPANDNRAAANDNRPAARPAAAAAATGNRPWKTAAK